MKTFGIYACRDDSFLFATEYGVIGVIIEGEFSNRIHTLLYRAGVTFFRLWKLLITPGTILTVPPLLSTK